MKAFSKLTGGIALGVILLGVLICPIAAAAADEDYTLLEPSVLPGEQTSTTFENYVEQGFRTFLAVVVIIAIVMLTASGLQYIISGSGGGKGEAKTRALAAILGLLIALSAYLILRTINPDLVDLTLDIANRGGEAGRAGVAAEFPTNTGGGGGNTNNGNDSNNYGDGGPQNYTGPNGVYGPTPENEFEVRDKITTATNGKVKFNDGYGNNCAPGHESGCKTYVGGLNDDQVNGIIKLSNDCNCGFTITGAAEQGGHDGGGTGLNNSHYAGDAVDIRKESTVSTYIRANGRNAGNQGNGTRYYFGDSYFDDEDARHWHVRF